MSTGERMLDLFLVLLPVSVSPQTSMRLRRLLLQVVVFVICTVQIPQPIPISILHGRALAVIVNVKTFTRLNLLLDLKYLRVGMLSIFCWLLLVPDCIS